MFGQKEFDAIDKAFHQLLEDLRQQYPEADIRYSLNVRPKVVPTFKARHGDTRPLTASEVKPPSQ